MGKNVKNILKKYFKYVILLFQCNLNVFDLGFLFKDFHLQLYLLY